eukprot:EG_transcript_16747
MPPQLTSAAPFPSGHESPTRRRLFTPTSPTAALSPPSPSSAPSSVPGSLPATPSQPQMPTDLDPAGNSQPAMPADPSPQRPSNRVLRQPLAAGAAVYRNSLGGALALRAPPPEPAGGGAAPAPAERRPLAGGRLAEATEWEPEAKGHHFDVTVKPMPPPATLNTPQTLPVPYPGPSASLSPVTVFTSPVAPSCSTAYQPPVTYFSPPISAIISPSHPAAFSARFVFGAPPPPSWPFTPALIQ